MYFNNRNRNLTEAYKETVKEQKVIDFKILREEMGHTTKRVLEDVSSKLTKLLVKLDQHEDDIKGENYNDDNKSDNDDQSPTIFGTKINTDKD